MSSVSRTNGSGVFPFSGLMYESIMSTPEMIRQLSSPTFAEATAKAAAALKAVNGPLVITGCGTSRCVAEVVSHAFARAAGRYVLISDPAELRQYPPSGFEVLSGAVLGISHTGGSIALREVIHEASIAGALTVGITDDAASPLAGLVDHALIGPGGIERAYSKTRSFSTAVLRMLLLSDQMSDNGDRTIASIDEIADMTEETLQCVPDHVAELAASWSGVNRFVCVGSGPNYGTAREVALKIIETVGAVAAHFVVEEFAHGVALGLTADTGVIVFDGGDSLSARTREIVEASVVAGAKVAVISTRHSTQWSPAASVVQVPEVPEAVSPMALILPAQLLVNQLARWAGRNPDTAGTDLRHYKEADSLLHPPGAH